MRRRFDSLSRAAMARYKHIDTQPKLIPVDLSRQLLPGPERHEGEPPVVSQGTGAMVRPGPKSRVLSVL
jgi:hypothetical protein